MAIVRQRPALAVVGGTEVGDRPEAPGVESVAFSDLHLARQFVYIHGQDWRYAHAENVWRRWDGTRWAIDRTQAVLAEMAKFLSLVAHGDLAQQLPPSQRRALESKSTIADVTYVAGFDEMIAVPPDQWDKDPWSLVTPAGTVELKPVTYGPRSART